MKKQVALVLCIFWSISFLFSQDAGVLMDSVRSQLEDIHGYSVKATFHVDISFVNMPDKDALIVYEAPNKLEVTSDGFLLVPRMGLKPLVKQFDDEKFISIYQGEESVNGHECHIIKLLPAKKNSKIILSTLWIRKHDFLVAKMEIYAKKAGHIMVDLAYEKDVLPSSMIFSFTIGEMNIPLKYFGNEVELDRQMISEAEGEAGKVTVSFKDYQIQYAADSE
jgi:hypothetical protein